MCSREDDADLALSITFWCCIFGAVIIGLLLTLPRQVVYEILISGAAFVLLVGTLYFTILALIRFGRAISVYVHNRLFDSDPPAPDEMELGEPAFSIPPNATGPADVRISWPYAKTRQSTTRK